MRKSEPSRALSAKRYLVHGRVQGVGYRYFAERAAHELNLAGYAKNLDDGRVEVYVVGTPEQIAEISGRLRQGPRWGDVRGVDEREAPVVRYTGFHIE